MTWVWLSMSGMNYTPQATAFGLETAGWFWLGLPMILGTGLAISLPLTWVARRFNAVISWTVTLGIAFVVIGYTFVSALPQSRINYALGIYLPADTKILSLHATDSFNDGLHLRGTVSGTEQLLQQIVAANGLSRSRIYLQEIDSNDSTFPVDSFENDLIACYFDPRTNKIHFEWRSGLPNP